ncbi:MAG: DUF4846 domain-containing protein [Proteobacteria bacterium]|nr:DUF4846 domain-containing protein [Pseudomonadota bacterium]
MLARADDPRRVYPWMKDPVHDTIAKRFEPPAEFKRTVVNENSFGHWLRHLPLKLGLPPVLLHDGELKSTQDVHQAVLDIDVGKRDLQQCADAVMRLRAEYLWSIGRQGVICFRSAAGPRARWTSWRDGLRPPKGKAGPWKKATRSSKGYRSFRAYLNKVFGVANSASLLRQMKEVDDPTKVESGDVYIEGATRRGFGHAVIVMDIAENREGKRVFLISQSYMPAQDIHILKNPNDLKSPWYEATEDGSLDTPEWSFRPGSLRRFRKGGC